MKIAEVERLTGISKQTIRFYEKEGLIEPGRNNENRYREYDAQDVKKLKRISLMRKLNVPISEIKEVMDGTRSFAEAIDVQRAQILKEREEQDALIAFCDELKVQSVEWLDEDYFLNKMTAGKRKIHPVRKFLEDFREVYRMERKRRISFYTQDFVTSPREFTDELLRYAKEHDADITIIKEGMNPHFVLNGIEYQAIQVVRMWKHGVQMVYCNMLHPELAEPVGVEENRKIFMQWSIRLWPVWIAVIILLIGILFM